MSGPQEVTQKTTTELGPEQREMFQLAMPGLREFAATPPVRPGFSGVAPINATQQVGHEMLLRGALGSGNIANQAAGANTSLLTDLWNPDSNPNLQAAIRGAVRPINEQLTETTLPAIRGSAIQSGNFGGSRHGIAEGMASREASRAAGDVGAKLTQQTYDTNVNAVLKALGLAPQTAGMMTQPGGVVTAVGDTQRGYGQELLNEQLRNFNFDNYGRFMQAKDILGLVSGMPGGTTVATGSAPQPGMMQGLGGAMAGAQLGGMLFPGIGHLAGAGLGGLLPFL